MPQYRSLHLFLGHITVQDLGRLERGNIEEEDSALADILIVEESEIGYDIYPPAPALMNDTDLEAALLRLGHSDYFVTIMRTARREGVDLVRFSKNFGIETRFPLPDRPAENPQSVSDITKGTNFARIELHDERDHSAPPTIIGIQSDSENLLVLEIATEDGPVQVGITPDGGGVKLTTFSPTSAGEMNDLYDALITVNKSGTTVEGQSGRGVVFAADRPAIIRYRKLVDIQAPGTHGAYSRMVAAGRDAIMSAIAVYGVVEGYRRAEGETPMSIDAVEQGDGCVPEGVSADEIASAAAAFYDDEGNTGLDVQSIQDRALAAGERLHRIKNDVTVQDVHERMMEAGYGEIISMIAVYGLVEGYRRASGEAPSTYSDLRKGDVGLPEGLPVDVLMNEAIEFADGVNISVGMNEVQLLSIDRGTEIYRTLHSAPGPR